MNVGFWLCERRILVVWMLDLGYLDVGFYAPKGTLGGI